MHIEIPGIFSLTVPWLLVIGLLVLVPILIRLVRSGSEKSPKSIDSDPLLCGGKVAKAVSYHQTDRISKIAKRTKGNLVVVLDVSGSIIDTMQSVSPFARRGATFGRDLGAALERVALLPEVKVVVCRYSTPGGTVTGSAHLSRGIDACRAAGKKIVAFVPDLSASGGVWSMVSADYIIADKHAILGSIGVRGPQIMTYDKVTSLGGLFGGVEAQTITSTAMYAGKGKTFGDPFTPLDVDELAHFQTIMDEAYDIFLDRVTSCRPQLTRETLVNLGARIFSAKKACQIGLIDAVGELTDVKDYVAKSIGVTWADCSLVYLQSTDPKGISRLFAECVIGALQTYSGAKGIQASDVLAAQTVQVYYAPPVVTTK